MYFFLSAIFYPPTFTTHSFVHKEDGMSREELPPAKKKITVTNKEQEPIFSDGLKPPATSVSENLLKFSNSSFSDSDRETARTWNKLMLNGCLRAKESQCSTLST